MQKLAVNALGDTVVAHDDVLFGAGDSAEAAYFVQSGRLQPGHQIFQMGLSQNGSPSPMVALNLKWSSMTWMIWGCT